MSAELLTTLHLMKVGGAALATGLVVVVGLTVAQWFMMPREERQAITDETRRRRTLRQKRP